MNYDDRAQQQYYMQRLQQQQQQRMNIPMQQPHNPSIVQQHPQHMRQPFNMVQQPQQIMVQMPIMSDDPNNQHYSQSNNRDLFASLPPNVQNQIANERDVETRRQIFQNAAKQQQMFEQQLQQQQGGMVMRLPMNVVQPQRMPISQGGVYPGQQVLMQQPAAQIQRIPSQGSFGQSPGQPSQMYIPNNQIGQTVRGATAMHPMPINQPYFQQQFQQQTQQQHIIPKQHISGANIINPQQQQHSQITPSNSVESNIGLDTLQQNSLKNSQVIQHFDSVNNHPPISQSEGQSTIPLVDNMTGIRLQNTPDQQLPRSAGTPLSMNSSQQQQNEAETQEYKELFEELKTYYLDVKRELERLNIDKREMKLRSSLTKVIQVMEGKTPVTKELLKKLLGNVKTVLENYNISRKFLLIAGRLKVAATKLNGKEIIPKESLFLDPWKDVRHLQIKIPECVLLKKNEIKKRSLGTDKKEEIEPPTKRLLLDTLAESFSTPKNNDVYKINCIDGSELILNSILSKDLGKSIQQGFKFDFDSDHVPVSNNCPSLHVRFYRQCGKSNISTTLFLLIPTNYPKSQINILPETSNGSTAMDIFLEKIDSNLINTSSLGSVLTGWINCFN